MLLDEQKIETICLRCGKEFVGIKLLDGKDVVYEDEYCDDCKEDDIEEEIELEIDRQIEEKNSIKNQFEKVIRERNEREEKINSVIRNKNKDEKLGSRQYAKLEPAQKIFNTMLMTLGSDFIKENLEKEEVFFKLLKLSVKLASDLVEALYDEK